jgi:hypothetical protein
MRCELLPQSQLQLLLQAWQCHLGHRAARLTATPARVPPPPAAPPAAPVFILRCKLALCAVLDVNAPSRLCSHMVTPLLTGQWTPATVVTALCRRATFAADIAKEGPQQYCDESSRAVQCLTGISIVHDQTKREGKSAVPSTLKHQAQLHTPQQLVSIHSPGGCKTLKGQTLNGPQAPELLFTRCTEPF